MPVLPDPWPRVLPMNMKSQNYKKKYAHMILSPTQHNQKTEQCYECDQPHQNSVGRSLDDVLVLIIF